MAEGILIDFSEDLPSVSDSVELFRKDVIDNRQTSFHLASPLKVQEQLLMSEKKASSPPKEESPPASPGNIEDEVFDFDLPVTPSTASDKSSDEMQTKDDDEVFFGPVGFTERCVSTAVTTVQKENKPLSPLTPRSLAKICEEANAVASHISAVSLPGKKKKCVNNIFKPEAVYKLLKAANKRHDEDKENSSDTTDSRPNSSDEATVPLEVRVSLDCNIKEKSNKQVSQLSKLRRRASNEISQEGESQDADVSMDGIQPIKNSSSEEDCDTPSKKHNRTGTFTVSQVPHEMLPAHKRISLPVVDGQSLAAVEMADEKLKAANSANKRSASKLLQPTLKLARVKGGLSNLPALKKVTKCPSPEEQKEAKPTSRLSLPKTTSRRQSTDDTTVGRSKLKPPGLSRSNSTACRPQQIPQRSGLQQPSLKPPAMMKLMKPGSLQRPVHTKLNDSTKKAPTGPMKATIPSTQMSASKKDLGVRKNSETQETCRTPPRSGSTSSREGSTPGSSINRRRSFLPTPKSRLGSCGSTSTPGSLRKGSSVSSCESPLVSGSGTRQRRISSSSSVGKYSRLEQYDDSSPSALRPKKALVSNTPKNDPVRKLSAWSPVRKTKPIDPIDQAIMCTKKIKR